ncbi:DUF3566 domain-containing protein [Prescottella sp. R16]|uniref:DUF3566 domain-containing protein n=1 Tax=Prescottella sp. R16 TaxID=3064529 RepID=UPI00272E5CCC|nr:DUF3566 domain-containing protein [Prescottella sp. R16]
MSTPRKPGEQGDGATRVEPAESAPEAATSKKPAPKADEPKKPAPKADEPKKPAPKADEPKQTTPETGKPAAGTPVDGEPAPDTSPQQRPVQTPPWQRGQQQRSAQNSATPQVRKPVAPPAPAKTGPEKADPKPPGRESASTPPSRPVVTGTAAPKQGKPVVTGTAAPKPAGTGTAAPQQGKPVVTGAAAPEHGGRPVVTGTAAPGARSKAAAIDGPTRSIARPDLAKDMPDLSEVKHPSTAPAPGGARKAAASALAVPAPVAGEGLRATVQLRRIDPWSALKVSLVISVALFFVWMVAVGLLYVVLDGMGVWDRLNNAFTEIITDSSTGGLVSSGQVFGYSALIGLMNVVLFTALATIGSFIYNLCSDLVGGVQVTLADPD